MTFPAPTRRSWVWDVEMRDDSDRRCATSRVTIAVQPAGSAIRLQGEGTIR